MKELLEDLKISKVAYLLEKIEKCDVNKKIKAFKKLEKYKITKRIGLFLIENSTKNYSIEDELGGVNSSLIELCIKNYYDEYTEAIEKVFPDLSESAKNRVLYLLTTVNNEKALTLYSELVVKYFKNKDIIPIGDLHTRPLSYPYLFPNLYKALKNKTIKNNILILLSNYLNAGIVPKEDFKKNKKAITDAICKIFEEALKYKFKNSYDGLHNPEYKDLRYFLEVAVNIESYVSGRKTKDYLEKLFKKNDNQLKLFILDNYMKKDQDISKLNLNPIARDKASRYALFELFTIYDKIDLFPKRYLNQKLLAESDFYTNFVIASSYVNEPLEMEYYDKVEKDGFDYYAFKFKCKYSYSSLNNDYLTNYICNQVGIEKYDGEKITSDFVGISGGFNADNKHSLVAKNQKKLQFQKLEKDDDINKIIDNLISESDIPVIQESKKTKKKKEKIKKSFDLKSLIKFKKETNKVTKEKVPKEKKLKENKKFDIKNLIKFKKENKEEKPKKEKIKKEKKIKEKKVKEKKEKKFFFKKNLIKFKKVKVKKEKVKKEKLPKPPKVKVEKPRRQLHIFRYILLFLFAVFIGLLVYCILYIYGVGSINDGLNDDVIIPVKLNDKGNFTEIRASEIFNQMEDEYFVLLYTGASKKTDKYYKYINEYSKRNYRFYYVDLNNEENKFLYGINDMNFTIYGDRLLKVKEKEYEYYVDEKSNILKEMQNQINEMIEKEKEEAKAKLEENNAKEE